jgi:large subunit ribosomal protein L35
MPKQKTHKGLSKRVKITARGKVKFHNSGAGHLMSSKNAKRRRRVTGTSIMFQTIARKAKLLLPR